MDDYIQKKQTCTPQQATALTQSVLKMIIKDMRPISIVDGEGFQEMIHDFNQEYILPSRTHFTKLMEDKYNATHLKVGLYLFLALSHSR